MSPSARDVRSRFLALLDLYDISVEIMRQNLRRRRPGATEEEIQTGLRCWLMKADEQEQVPWTTRRRAAS